VDSISDLAFFVQLVKHGSLSALARDLGLTPPAVTTRLARMEARLGVRLLNRTTRRISVTQEGELYLSRGAQLLLELEELDRMVSSARATPKGLLRVNATFGFGRRHIAPAVSEFARRFTEVEVQLTLTDRTLNLADQAYDVGIWFGQVPDSRLVARRIAPNRRFLCAAPKYLEAVGVPLTPRDLHSHKCIVLREHDATFGTWYMTRGRKHETVKVRGALSSNDGETALVWALDGHGVVMRSEWDVYRYLRSGALRVVLPEWALPSADVHVVYGERLSVSAKVIAFVDFLGDWFGQASAREAGSESWMARGA
jgi:LysR family transcriptional regulator, transcriptional activator for dmlA